MRAGDKVLTPDGPGTIVKRAGRGVYIIWKWVRLDSGDLKRYAAIELRKQTN